MDMPKQPFHTKRLMQTGKLAGTHLRAFTYGEVSARLKPGVNA